MCWTWASKISLTSKSSCDHSLQHIAGDGLSLPSVHLLFEGLKAGSVIPSGAGILQTTCNSPNFAV